MSRLTYLKALEQYRGAMRPYLSEATLTRKAKNLRTVYRDLLPLMEERGLGTLCPSKIGTAELEALLLRWRARLTGSGRTLDPATQATYLCDLDGFLSWCGNPAVQNLKRSRFARLPRRVSKPILVLGPEELERLSRAADGMESWGGSVARLLVAVLPASGMRPKEFRLARLEDLDTARWRILVSHPKGEGTWGVPDYAPILPSARPAVLDYLEERRVYLGRSPCPWLVPYRRVSGEVGPWSEAMLRKLKGEIAAASGVRFSLKTFRATFAQMAKDRGASIEAVSRALRHGSTDTTEEYYARIRAEDAFRELERAFEAPRVAVSSR